jgi:hypothetical protein
MEEIYEFGKEKADYFEVSNDTETIYVNFNFDGYKSTLAKGDYRIIVTFSTQARHLSTTSLFVEGRTVGITGAQITDLQEIATDGYHFGYGTAEIPVYQQADKDKFEVVYGDYGLQISASGIKVKKPETGWTSL